MICRMEMTKFHDICFKCDGKVLLRNRSCKYGKIPNVCKLLKNIIDLYGYDGKYGTFYVKAFPLSQPKSGGLKSLQKVLK